MGTGGRGNERRWRRTAATPGRRHTCGSASHHHSPAPVRLCPSSRRRLHIRYPGGRGLRGRGRTAWPPGARSAGDAAVAPRGGGSKSAPTGELTAAAKVATGEMAAPSEPAPNPAAAGTSYWMYCFLHSGVMCAERCSANFILPCPPHSHPAPAATGGGGGNCDSDSSPHGPRRCAELRFSPPPPPPRSPQSRPPAIFLLLFIAPPRPAL